MREITVMTAGRVIGIAFLVVNSNSLLLFFIGSFSGFKFPILAAVQQYLYDKFKNCQGLIQVRALQ
jgi:hypothetical protein